MRLVDPAPIRELLDQEVMLRCLSEAASTDRSGDFAAGQAGRRMERRLSIGQMLLDLRRGDLWAERFRAAELRCDARALRAEAQQVRRRLHA